MTFDGFIQKYNGKGIDFDGYYGFQCMDLAHQYCVEVIGKDFQGQPTAADVWNLTIDGYDKIENSPTGIPSKGDVVIWGTGVGASGHIAVFISGNADSFQSFDQNWPLGSLCHIQSHNYTGVLGWFHPQQVSSDTVSVGKVTFEKLVTKSTAYDAFVSSGYATPADVKVKLDATQAVIDGLTKDKETLQGQYNDSQTKLAACQTSLGNTVDEPKVLAYLKAMRFWDRIILFSKT